MNPITRGIRSAFRNAVRTFSIIVILGLSIGLGLTMLVAHQAVGQKVNAVKSSIGNTVTIAPAGFQGGEGGGNPLTTDQLKDIKNISHVTAVNETLTDRLDSTNTNLQSAIAPGSLGKRFMLHAERNGQELDPSKISLPIPIFGTTDPTTVGGLSVPISSGKNVDGNADVNNAIIGKGLADKNGLGVGSTFQAYGQTITVVGIYDTGNTFTNAQVVMSLPALQRLSNQPNDVTDASVTLDSVTNIDSVVASIKGKLGSSADVTSTKDSVEQALSPLESIQKVSLFSLIGAAAAGAVIILLTMIMIVRERKREIGVIKAIGGSSPRIVLQFMSEALTLTVLGAVIGIMLGVVGGSPVTNMLVNNSTSSSNNTNKTQMMGGGPVVTSNGGAGQSRGFLRGLGNNNAVQGLKNIKATVGWSVPAYGLASAVGIALIGSGVAAGMISKIRPAQVMRAD